MRSTAIRTTVLTIALVSTLAACGGKDKASTVAQVPAATSEPTPEVVETTAAPEPVVTSAAPAPLPSAEAMVDFKLPNFKGANLQDAQNQVQELGIFYSISHDLRGSRNQVLDSNWQVCNQTPPAGTLIRGKAADYEGEIDFGVVKLAETCP